MKNFALIFIFVLFLPDLTKSDGAGDTINATQILNDGDTLVSANETYELGFFSPGSSSLKYLAIRYNQIYEKTIAWVANREVGIPSNSSGVLQLSQDGILILDDGESAMSLWSSNASKAARDPVAQLLDSGNLVVRDRNDSNPENYLWQSFDYPGDTALTGTKYGINKKTGLDRSLRSWKTSDDPSPGNYTNGFDISGLPQIVLRKNSEIIFRSGPWNGLQFSGSPATRASSLNNITYVSNDEEVYLLSKVNSSTLTRLYVSPQGVLEWYMWTGTWYLNVAALTDACDTYGTCGAYGMCDNNTSPICSCLNGFEPRDPQEWELGTGTGGCVRKTELNCLSDEFQKIAGVKVPDMQNFTSNSTMNLDECRRLCLKNCRCTAYGNWDVREGGSGCLQWFGDLVDMRSYPESEQNIYYRLSASDIATTDGGNSSSSKTVGIAVGVSLSVVAVFIIGLALAYVWRRKYRKSGVPTGKPEENSDEDLDLPIFDLATIVSATNDFSFQNKLGEGGFGPVYKGILRDGQEIAVKRLSAESRQGTTEFKNEVSHIAKLQHRNLVKLLGCCIEANEKMLIYEFMPNKSLDYFLFDRIQGMSLSWSKRYHIINGIARGLLYLHQDSRLRIIHRDLKASNVLLDNEMNPKISDFGLARSFGEMETKVETKTVVGTYGYMSPEYATDGLYSIKSDVFSYGVLLLEIVSGRKNRGFNHPDHHHNLLGHAWRLFNEDKSWDLLAETIREMARNTTEVLRSIQIGLLCVQRSPDDRPSMSGVVLMLGGEGQLPQPKQPGFFTERDVGVGVGVGEGDSSTSSQRAFLANDSNITVLEPR